MIFTDVITHLFIYLFIYLFICLFNHNLCQRDIQSGMTKWGKHTGSRVKHYKNENSKITAIIMLFKNAKIKGMIHDV